MKVRTALILALVVTTTAGSVGAIRNVIREATDEEAAAAATVRASELSRAATRDEAAWTGEINRLRNSATDLERHIFADDPDVVVAGGELSLLARRLGVTVLRLDTDPTRGIVSIAGAGPEAATFGWLRAVERTMSRDGGMLEHLVVTAEPANQMTVAIEIRYLRHGESVPSPGGPSRSRLLEAAETWPAPGVQTVAAAFLGRPVVEEHSLEGEAAPDPTPPQPVAAAGRVELIGIASVDGITRYALRFVEEQSIRTLEVGQQAFGWNLIEAGRPGLVLQKEGQHYAIPR